MNEGHLSTITKVDANGGFQAGPDQQLKERRTAGIDVNGHSQHGIGTACVGRVLPVRRRCLVGHFSWIYPK